MMGDRQEKQSDYARAERSTLYTIAASVIETVNVDPFDPEVTEIANRLKEKAAAIRSQIEGLGEQQRR